MTLLLQYFGYLSRMCSTLIMMCVLLIPLCAIMFFVLRVWIQQRKKHQRAQLNIGADVLTVGFFHPYCHAGGGERVLWMAVSALQNWYQNVRCIVYTGDRGTTGEAILARAKERFNIHLPKSIDFIFLTKRDWVEASSFPHFTLLGQSLGSMYLGLEALGKFVPDVFIDSMGYAFTLPIFKYLGKCCTSCYVHYPTISNDMLERVSNRTDAHNNASFVAQSSVLSRAKLVYYHLFAFLYGIAGKSPDVVLVNSSWTEGQILHFWRRRECTFIVYPPCNTTEFLKMPFKVKDEKYRTIVSIAQFRPEKDHPLQIKSFEKFLARVPFDERKFYKLILIGSCRNSEDQERVDRLKDLCDVLSVREYVEFKLNVPFNELKEHLSSAAIGLHTMWTEHFGIGVVECMAAGTIILAHNSGGPKMDIVVEYNGKPTGFLAYDEDSYAGAMETILKMPIEESLAMRLNARDSVTRFSDEEFVSRFLDVTETLFAKK